MNLHLTGKLALVTGSTAGIGFAIAESLVAEGTRVVLNGRTEERVEAAVQRLKSNYPEGSVSGIAADLSTAEGAATVTKSLSDIDILINNMGIFEPKQFEDIADEDWLKMFQANVMSGVRLSRYYLAKMKAKDWGRIIFISSESAVNIPVEMIHYGMTKSAQISIARGLAEMTAGTNVTINSVLPGPTASEGVSTFIDKLAAEQKLSTEEMEKKFFEVERPSSLLKRFIEPKEIGDFVAFVASPLSSAINGAALRAEGGLLRSMI